ncbi:hypothetical protein GOBAR_AA12672 [Gossypium barbadense]|uniref:Uncharacterized protein n=1 Tax=Gossypium barbadense TaxID=3634 RepID=A0A2P5XXC1_GOSBA|nr:hypothetical protein GOBAR_AA12672 [Gossypium barbadense]
MNELLELGLWRIIGQSNDEGEGGYSVVVEVGFHKCCAKRILYLKLAMVVVEQGMAVVDNLSQRSFKFLSNSELWSSL